MWNDSFQRYVGENLGDLEIGGVRSCYCPDPWFFTLRICRLVFSQGLRGTQCRFLGWLLCTASSFLMLCSAPSRHPGPRTGLCLLSTVRLPGSAGSVCLCWNCLQIESHVFPYLENQSSFACCPVHKIHCFIYIVCGFVVVCRPRLSPKPVRYF